MMQRVAVSNHAVAGRPRPHATDPDMVDHLTAGLPLLLLQCGLIVTRSDSSINTLADLVNKTITMVHPMLPDSGQVRVEGGGLPPP